MKILLSAGHGGTDSGSIGADKGKEKDILKKLLVELGVSKTEVATILHYQFILTLLTGQPLAQSVGIKVRKKKLENYQKR